MRLLPKPGPLGVWFRLRGLTRVTLGIFGISYFFSSVRNTLSVCLLVMSRDLRNGSACGGIADIFVANPRDPALFTSGTGIGCCFV
jgi:hypothetical protein